MFFQNDAILVQLADLAKQSDYLICTPHFDKTGFAPSKDLVRVPCPCKAWTPFYFSPACLIFVLC